MRARKQWHWVPRQVISKALHRRSARLAYARAQLGDHRGALPALVAAAAQQLEVGDHVTVSGTLLMVAATFTELEAHESSAIVHGAADQMNGYRGWFGPAVEDRDRSIEASSAALGVARFAELRERGTRMRDDEAVAFGAAKPRSNYSSSSRNFASSMTSTPSCSAFVSFVPGLSPAST